MRKEFNSQRILLVHQHGRRFIVLEHQYGRRDVMWKRSIRSINDFLANKNLRRLRFKQKFKSFRFKKNVYNFEMNRQILS